MIHCLVQVKEGRMEAQHAMLPAMAPRAHGPATVADLAGLEHHELVGGELVEKASPTIRHGLVHGNLISAVHDFVGHGRGEGRPGGWWIGPEVTIELEPGEVYQPDIAGWRMERLPVLSDEWPMRVTPDWVCEILSPSTARLDLGPKQQAYHRARVGHYWVADPIHCTIAVYRRQADGYMLALAAGLDDIVRAEPFESIEINLGEIFGLPPKKG